MVLLSDLSLIIMLAMSVDVWSEVTCVDSVKCGTVIEFSCAASVEVAIRNDGLRGRFDLGATHI